MKTKFITYVVAAAVCLGSIVAAAQETPTYKPPLRGAPGGRVSGASRGETSTASIELLTPDSHTGLTAGASPTLYYYVSRGVSLPVNLSIRAPNEARPLVDASLPPPRAEGIYAINLATYRAQLQPNVLYTWSVSVTVDPRSPSNDVVASATVMRTAATPSVDAAARAAGPAQRVGVYANAGLWYEALAAAAENAGADRHAAFDALLDQVGLRNVASFDRKSPGSLGR